MAKNRNKMNIVKKTDSFYSFEGGRLRNISCDDILKNKNESNLCHLWKDVIPREDQEANKKLKMLLDGFPVYVPHHRLILISDMKKNVIDINLHSK